MSNNLCGKLIPISDGGWSHRFNFDGLLTYDGDMGGGQVGAYTQLFHNGIVEAVDTWLLKLQGDKKSIPCGFELELVEAVNRYMAFLIDLGVDLPLWICLSLLGVKGYFMEVGPRVFPRKIHSIEREDLILPEIEVTDREQPMEQILKPAFDSIWNACGYEQSQNYDEQGKWLLKDNR